MSSFAGAAWDPPARCAPGAAPGEDASAGEAPRWEAGVTVVALSGEAATPASGAAAGGVAGAGVAGAGGVAGAAGFGAGLAAGVGSFDLLLPIALPVPLPPPPHSPMARLSVESDRDVAPRRTRPWTDMTD